MPERELDPMYNKYNNPDNRYNGLNASHDNGINLKSSLEDFLKKEYTEGMRNEFAVMDALINSLSKDTITGKKKYKSFALGITDNIRGLGYDKDQRPEGYASDLYDININDFMKAADTVDAEFDTTKLMGVFSITDETLLKGSTDGSLFDVLGDTLNRMQMGLKHTMNRYTYGSRNGKIGKVVAKVKPFNDTTTDENPANPGEMCGNSKITADIIEVQCTNSMSLLPGMGIMLKDSYGNASSGQPTVKYRQGKIWQKDDASFFDHESLIVVLDVEAPGDATSTELQKALDDNPGVSFHQIEIYARQLSRGKVAREYTGLQDIVIDNANVFGVNRNVYRTLKCLQRDMKDAQGNPQLLTESDLRDMADKITLVTPEGASPNLVCAKHSIIATLEKQMYQFKQYSIDTSANGFQLGGRPNIKFDNFELKKDKYARDRNVYILDTTKIGELIRKDFGWITSGRETILERRDGTEIYEAIMTKYADMYIDAWKAHASFINVKDDIGSAGLYSRQVVVTNTTDNPVNTKPDTAAAADVKA